MRNSNKAQVSTEYLLLMGMALTSIGILLIWFLSSVSDVDEMMAETSVNKLDEGLKQISRLGIGSRITLKSFILPKNYKSSTISNNSFSMYFSLDGNLQEYYHHYNFNLTGNLPTYPGTFDIALTKISPVTIAIGKENNMLYITKLSPSGTINNEKLEMVVITNLFSKCRYDTNKKPFSEMDYEFNGTLKMHSAKLNLTDGYYEYFVSCYSESEQIETDLGKNITFTVN